MRQRGLVARRSAAEATVLGAAALTVLVTTSLLTALVAYSGAVTRAGVAAVVDDAPARRVSVEVSAPPADNPAAGAAFDAQVDDVAADAFAGLDPGVFRSAISSSFALPNDAELDGRDGRPPLTVLVAYDDLTAHADLVSGDWATDPVAGGPLPVTVHDEAAGVLGLVPGDALTLTTRSDDGSLDVVVAGTYRPRDVGDPAFFDDGLETSGRDDGSFLALGPLATTPAGYEERVGGRTVVRWRIAPDPARLDVDGISRAVAGAQQIEAEVEDDTVSITGQSARILVDTSLPDLAGEIAGPVQVARSTVAVPVLLLSLLGAIALVLTVLLLSERRRSETATLRARGATRAQVGMWAGVEALVVVVPAAVLGPLGADAVLQGLDAVGPLAGTDLALSSAPDAGRWVTASLVAVTCGVVLVALVLATATGSRQAAHPSRPSRRTVISRAGVDLALLGFAALALLQLRQYGIAGTPGLTGTGTDPLVVAAPAVVVLAVAVVALRALPLVTAAVQGGLRSGGPVGTSLALWHVGRRPGRYAGPALLLVMATAVGTLSLAYTATWTTAQYDLAAQEAGADVRVTATALSRAELSASDRGRVYRAAPGVEAVMGVARLESRGTESNTVLAVDGEQADHVMVTRPDLLAGASVAELAAPLVAERPSLPTVPLPDDAEGLQVTATLDALSDDLPTLPPVLSALLVDGSGTLTRVPLGELQPDGEPQALSAPLEIESDRSADGLSLVAIDLTVDSFLLESVALELTVADLAVSRTAGTEPVSLDEWVSAATGGSSLDRPPEADVSSTEGGFRSRLTSGRAERLGATTTVFRYALAGVPMPVTSLQQVSGVAPPAVATRALAEREDLAVGDKVVVQGPGGPLVVGVTAVVDRLPTIEADAAAVLVDLPTLATLELLRDVDPVQADEWWLSTAPGASGRVAEAVATASGAPERVIELESRAQERLTSPLGIGLAGALGVGAFAALVVTAIGFAVHGAASARERLTEFAFLRAMGFSRRQLLGVLATEQGLLAAVGVLLGVVVGAVSSVLLVPSLVAPALAEAAPPLRLTVEPWAVGAFAAVVLAVLALVAGAVAGALRRQGLGTALRLGEDR